VDPVKQRGRVHHQLAAGPSTHVHLPHAPQARRIQGGLAKVHGRRRAPIRALVSPHVVVEHSAPLSVDRPVGRQFRLHARAARRTVSPPGQGPPPHASRSGEIPVHSTITTFTGPLSTAPSRTL